MPLSISIDKNICKSACAYIFNTFILTLHFERNARIYVPMQKKVHFSDAFLNKNLYQMNPTGLYGLFYRVPVIYFYILIIKRVNSNISYVYKSSGTS
jgi:hypothetical protein